MKRLRNDPPTMEELATLSDVFKVFGDATRIRLLWLLSQEECCVTDLARQLEMEQSAVSHQLRLLRQARLVRYRREGKNLFYTLDDDHVHQIIALGLSHIREQ
ncbi:MAG: ArsR/SmtB family transcription factor [Acutalibacteraceae bacterium]